MWWVVETMFKNQKVTVVMPAYNAAMTLEKTYAEVIVQDFVDDIIMVDDGMIKPLRLRINYRT